MDPSRARPSPPHVPPRSALDLLVVAGGATVAWVGFVALVLANLGAFRGWLVLVLGALVPAAAVLMAWRRRDAVTVEGVTVSDLVLVGVCGVLTAGLLVPGFPYLVGDKDPGVYAAHALAIERTGDAAVPDPVLQRADAVPVTNYLDADPLPARFPGYWVDPRDPEQVRPQFFHLLPALLATASTAGGTQALFNVVPALAGLALLALALAVRRVLGTLPAVLTAALLGANAVQVWHARHPSTEILVQLFVATAALSLVVAVTWRVRWPAAVAGALVAAAFVARPDGLLLVVLAAAAAAAVWAMRPEGRIAPAFGAGLVAGLPYALYQAYYQNRTYMLANDLPDWPLVVAAALAIGAGALALRRIAYPRLDGWLRAVGARVPRNDLRLTAAAAVAAVTAVLLVVAWYRPDLFDPVMATTLDGRRIARLDEWNLRKLSWFVTVPGLVAMWAGLVLLVRRRDWALLWLVVLPGTVLFPLFVWQARIESRVFWWGRRFLPVILPAVAVLMAAAVAAAIAHRGRWRQVVSLAGALLAAYLVLVPLSQSIGLRDHREYGGSVELIEEVAGVRDGDPSVFLWQFPADGDAFDPSRVLGGPVWFVHGQVSTLLPREPVSGDVDSFARAFPDRRLFVVSRGTDPLDAIAGTGAAPVLRVSTALAHWQEADFERPTEAISIPFDFTVWEVPGVRA